VSVVTDEAARTQTLIQIGLLGEAVEHVPVGFFVFDEDGKYVAVNQYGCSLLGYERQELLTRRLGELAASPREAFHEYRDVTEGRKDEGCVGVRTKDGRELVLRFRGRETTITGVTFYVAVAWPNA
jgi:PAS domain S-box-containing protein